MKVANDKQLIFYNGTILPAADHSNNICSAVAIENGCIRAIGRDDEILSLATKNSRAIDLNGYTVLPGFIDSHCHPWMLGTRMLTVDCTPANVCSIADIINRLKKEAELTAAGRWIIGEGYDEQTLCEHRHPTRKDLDEVSREHPIFLRRKCLHVAVCNSVALQMSGIDRATPDPPGGLIDRDPRTQEPTGILRGTAIDLVRIPPFQATEMMRGLRRALHLFATHGVTTVHDAGVSPDLFECYQELAAKNQLPVRVRLWCFAHDALGFRGFLEEIAAARLRSGFGNSWLRFSGVKFMLDGGIAARTAALDAPYEDDPGNTGVLFFEEGQFTEMIYRAAQHGLRVAVHAVGERAIDLALRAFESVHRSGVDVKSMRARVEHCALPRQDHLEGFKRLGLVAAISTPFIFTVGDTYLARIGSERMSRVFPHRTMVRMGIPAPANSDCPVATINPFEGMYAATTRLTSTGNVAGPEEGLTISEALKAYTYWGAFSGFEENFLGRTLPGMAADLVIVDKNPLTLRPTDLREVQVKAVLVGGEVVYATDELRHALGATLETS